MKRKLFILIWCIMDLGTGIGILILVYTQFIAHFPNGLSDRIILGVTTAFFLGIWIRLLMDTLAYIRRKDDTASRIWAPDRSTKKKAKHPGKKS